ncbi:hypothetical protein L596_014749 [Steinernema carpocapsae]|uniref:Geranylgeranyl transferase type-2 subunit beta n=1 Tax=Steinernema carpocapsae TaxID=34508 RepID=A0A4U5NDP4_STECR|nr:hypothetical protein L596_014749 [Steinernema carpocapsae]
MSLGAVLDMARKDVTIPANATTQILKELHADFIRKQEKDHASLEYLTTEFLRMSGLYWCFTAMDLLGELEAFADAEEAEVVRTVRECQKPCGGIAPAPNHEAHILYTLSAVQIAVMLKFVDQLDVEGIVKYVKSRQNPDGSFGGDRYNEIDTRFSFCALAILHLLDRLYEVDTESATEYILSCHNTDGGFGTRPGSESHSGQVYCCLGSLAILGRLELIDQDRTGEWLAQRQCDSGGLNGRPDKLPDVCYSWWVLASLAILGQLEKIDKGAMIKFITACQDDETGGFSDRPGDVADPFHTVFGLAGLSLLEVGGLEPIDAVFCMTKKALGEKLLYR